MQLHLLVTNVLALRLLVTNVLALHLLVTSVLVLHLLFTSLLPTSPAVTNLLVQATTLRCTRSYRFLDNLLLTLEVVSIPLGHILQCVPVQQVLSLIPEVSIPVRLQCMTVR